MGNEILRKVHLLRGRQREHFRPRLEPDNVVAENAVLVLVGKRHEDITVSGIKAYAGETSFGRCGWQLLRRLRTKEVLGERVNRAVIGHNLHFATKFRDEVQRILPV